MGTRHDYDPRALTRHRRKVAARRGGGLTPRVRAAIDALVAGEANTYEAACAIARLSTRALRLALHKPEVLAYYKRELEALKDMERVRSLRRMIEVRDDGKLRETAAGSKVVLEAARAIHEDPGARGPGNVNIQINATTGQIQQRTPGYLVVTSAKYPLAEINEKLREAGSAKSVLDEPGAVQVIEDAEFEEVMPADPVRGPHSLPPGS